MSIEMVQKIAHAVHNEGGELWVIGGSVREMLFQWAHPTLFIHPSKDVDCEVYNIKPEVFETILTQFGDVDFIGKQFGVYHLDAGDFHGDFSFPRADSVGRKPKVEVNINLDKWTACNRRNYVCNSAMYNPLDGDMIDYFGAGDDIKGFRLDVVNEQTFRDDPLRPLIGLFLCGAYYLHPTISTLAMARQMVYEHDHLPPSRIWDEWWKWATRSVVPSKGLNYLKASGWLRNYPELDILDRIPQDKEWHPEGNVWQHTLLAVDSAADLTRYWEAEQRGIVMLAVLCHDLDKAITTCYGNSQDQWPLDCIRPDVLEMVRDGIFRIISPGHDQGIEVEKFLNRIHCPNEIKERVLALVRTHMAHIGGMKARKLLNRLGSNRPLDWLLVVTADHSARPPLSKGAPESATNLFLEMMEQPPEQVKPILMGRHLLLCGHKPSPAMGQILRNAFEFGQLENEYDTVEEGMLWLYGKGLISQRDYRIWKSQA